jgi:hypothetical protein
MCYFTGNRGVSRLDVAVAELAAAPLTKVLNEACVENWLPAIRHQERVQVDPHALATSIQLATAGEGQTDTELLSIEETSSSHIDLRAAVSSCCLSIDARSPQNVLYSDMFGRPMSYGDISWTKKAGWDFCPVPKNGTISPIRDTDYLT